ncbi:MAG: dipeptide/oligopeptide/nickel ABC transporter permease/ATP-binding protein [Microbacteriaceae bacterium]|nr:dipeptide/oligopeptide/nickel ABC transporter permease/ATP-binding protein [Microbacteriaceae bacterium]
MKHFVKPLVSSAFSVFALVIFALTLAAALLSFVWLPHDPTHSVASEIWAPPSAAHPLGGDGAGRDVLARLMVGSRTTLLVALVACVGVTCVSLALAAVTALAPNRLRGAAAAVVDVLIAFPTLIFAMLLVTVTGSGLHVVLLAIIFGFSASLSRVLRGEIAQAHASDFAVAARAAGVSRWLVFWRHTVLGASPVLATQAALAAGLSALAESSLTYLGFGVSAATPSWGRMLAQSQQALASYPLAAAIPGGAILLFALACFVFGDACRRLLDPRAREREQTRAGRVLAAAEKPGFDASKLSTEQSILPVSESTDLADISKEAGPVSVYDNCVKPQSITLDNDAEPLLLVRDLGVASDAGSLVQGVSLRVEAGEVLGIIGPSGSGKSLTAQAIAGILPQHLQASGEIFVAEQALHSLPEKQRAATRGSTVAYIFQEPKTALNPLMRISEQITFALTHHYSLTRAQKAEAARELAAQVELNPALLSRYPHELSGGQRQRAAIAAALSADPQVLIADEATSALDAVMQAQIVALLRRIAAEQNRALLFISHDIAEVASIADRVAVMHAGQIVEAGETSRVLYQASHSATRALLQVLPGKNTLQSRYLTGGEK